jgi:hypothetical protein
MPITRYYQPDPFLQGLITLAAGYGTQQRAYEAQENQYQGQQNQATANAVGGALGAIGSAPFQAMAINKQNARQLQDRIALLALQGRMRQQDIGADYDARARYDAITTANNIRQNEAANFAKEFGISPADYGTAVSEGRGLPIADVPPVNPQILQTAEGAVNLSAGQASPAEQAAVMIAQGQPLPSNVMGPPAANPMDNPIVGRYFQQGYTQPTLRRIQFNEAAIDNWKNRNDITEDTRAMGMARLLQERQRLMQPQIMRRPEMPPTIEEDFNAGNIMVRKGGLFAKDAKGEYHFYANANEGVEDTPLTYQDMQTGESFALSGPGGTLPDGTKWSRDGKNGLNYFKANEGTDIDKLYMADRKQAISELKTELTEVDEDSITARIKSIRAARDANKEGVSPPSVANDIVGSSRALLGSRATGQKLTKAQINLQLAHIQAAYPNVAQAPPAVQAAAVELQRALREAK